MECACTQNLGFTVESWKSQLYTAVADLGGVRVCVQMHPPLAASNVFLMHCSNNNQAQFIHSHMILTDVQTGLELLKLEIFS